MWPPAACGARYHQLPRCVTWLLASWPPRAASENRCAHSALTAPAGRLPISTGLAGNTRPSTIKLDKVVADRGARIGGGSEAAGLRIMVGWRDQHVVWDRAGTAARAAGRDHRSRWTIAPGARSWGGAEVHAARSIRPIRNSGAAQFILGRPAPCCGGFALGAHRMADVGGRTVMCLREAFGACRGVRAGSPFGVSSAKEVASGAIRWRGPFRADNPAYPGLPGIFLEP